MKNSNHLKHIISAGNHDLSIRIEIELGDPHRNGHEDFSITGSVYKNSREVSFGCVHDDILKLRPELKPFVDLHLSDYTGAPMHCSSNAFFWLAGWKQYSFIEYHGSSGCSGSSGRSGCKPEECKRIFKEHLRLTDEEVELAGSLGIIDESGMKAFIMDHNLTSRWKSEADAAIAQLEKWTGMKFESKATRSNFKPLDAAELSQYRHRVSAGWYSAESVAKRLAEAEAKRKADLIEKVIKDHNEAVEDLNNSRLFNVWVIETFGRRHGVNIIYYRHSNTIESNWTTTDKLITEEEWKSIVSKADLSKLPTGVKFNWNDKPKH